MEALKTKRLRVAPGTTRAVMKIEVVSAWKLPSGHDPGTNLRLLNIPLSKGEGKDSTTVAILDPKFRVEYLEISPGVKVPFPSFEINVFETNGDPADIGAKPRRIIHTRVLDSTVM
jgi:hypothetical protein